MKYFLIPALIFFSAFTANSQNNQQRSCGVMNHEQLLEISNPNRAIDRASFERLTQTENSRLTQNANASVLTVPVVVHIVLPQNLPSNQVLSQIQVLNEDFSRTNADAANTPAPFQSVAANTTIQFCMAHQDPDGNWTNGIEYRQSSATFSGDGVKSYAQGGLDAWDPSRYFNIWVCDLNFYLGYAEFPTSSVSYSYGVVIGYRYFGSNSTPYGSGFNLDATYDRGRTATHEIGHCFDLYHIWGDDGNSCSGTDYCADTPNQASETYGNPSFPQVDACSPNSPGIMFMNYMDYTDDVGMNIFTNDQKARMLAVLNATPYNALTTSNACQPNGTGNGIAPSLNVILYPNPSNGNISLQIPSMQKGPISFTVLNALGQVIYSESQNENHYEIYHLDLTGISKGVYFIEVKSGEEKIVERIIISD